MLHEPRCRQVERLLWAEGVKDSPWPKAKLSGLPALGKRYENRVAKALPGAVHGPWFKYYDANGLGYCSPDFVLSCPEGILVLECKLTWTEEALAQLRGLYIPVLEKVTGLPVVGGVVLKSLGRGGGSVKLVSNMAEMTKAAFGATMPPVLLAPLSTPTHTRHQFRLGY
jgi:hypothetical protein